MTEKEIIDAISFINAHKDIVGYNIARKATELIYKYDGYPDLDDIEHKRLYDFYEKHKEVCKGGDSYRLIELYTCGFTNTYVCNVCNESYDYTNYDKECWSDGKIVKVWSDEKKEKLPFSFIEVGTGIGSCITIVCTENNDSKDITDIDSW